MRSLVHEALLAGAVGSPPAARPPRSAPVRPGRDDGGGGDHVAVLSELDGRRRCLRSRARTSPTKRSTTCSPTSAGRSRGRRSSASRAARTERLVALHRDGIGQRFGGRPPPGDVSSAGGADDDGVARLLRCDAIHELDRATDRRAPRRLHGTGFARRATGNWRDRCSPSRWTHWSIAESAAHPELRGTDHGRRWLPSEESADSTPCSISRSRMGSPTVRGHHYERRPRAGGRSAAARGSGCSVWPTRGAPRPAVRHGDPRADYWVAGAGRGALSLPRRFTSRRASRRLSTASASGGRFSPAASVTWWSSIRTLWTRSVPSVRDLPAEGERLVRRPADGASARSRRRCGHSPRRGGVRADHGPGRVLRPLAGSG